MSIWASPRHVVRPHTHSMSTFLSSSPTATALAFEQEQEQDDFECPICYAVTPASSDAGVVLKTCQHQSCSSCLVRWIEKEETSGQEAPTCPVCRVNIDENDVHQIMGRSFEPRGVGVEEANNEEIDEFTLHWLNENTTLCQGCGSRIEKESGCNLIECLCGYRFCKYSICLHHFICSIDPLLLNLPFLVAFSFYFHTGYQCNAPGGRCECNTGHGFLGENWGSREEYIDQPIRGSDGFVDFKSCIERRRLQYEGQWERWDRRDLRHQRWRESEMFWGCTQPCKAIETCHGRWIFACKTNQASAQVLTNIFEAIAIEEGRRRWNRINTSENDVGSNWLFLREGADFRALEQLQNRHDVQYRRQYYRDYEICDWDMRHSVFMLQSLFDGLEVWRQRCEMRAANEEASFNNGAWLFS